LPRGVSLKESLTSSHTSIGLTLKELANLMLSLGCHSALNLDGGGSSTLWIDGKIANQTIGDQDEKLGQTIARPLSDAIVFKRKAVH
jgi:exopolysaccharide biosynthesis protein